MFVNRKCLGHILRVKFVVPHMNNCKSASLSICSYIEDDRQSQGNVK